MLTRETRDCPPTGKVGVLSFAFALAVVVIHCSWTADSAFGRLLILLVRDTLARMAVPFFFVCSGYFLARHLDEEGWWQREVGKRIFSLGMPYVLWTVVLAGVLFLETREVMGIGGLGVNLCKMPALASLWYVRCLFLFVLTLPFLKPALDRWRGAFLVVLYVVSLAVTVVAGRCGWSDEQGIGGLLAYGYSLEGLFFFLAGVYLRRYWRRPVARKTYLILAGAGLALVVLKLSLALGGLSVGFNLNLLITPLLLAGLSGTLRPQALPSALAGCTFPVYLMHGVVIVALRNLGGTYQPCNPWLELALGIVIPIAFCHLVHRYSRRLSRFLFGGR